MRGVWFEYLALSLWPLLVKHSPTPTCTVAMRHCPLARLSSWSMARALCAGTWRDDTKNQKKTLLPKDFAPRGVICVIVTIQMNALGQNLINIKHKESVVELKTIEQLVKWGLEGSKAQSLSVDIVFQQDNATWLILQGSGNRLFLVNTLWIWVSPLQ